MLKQRFFPALALAASACSSSAYALELVDTTDTLRKEDARFVSIENATASMLSMTLSSGEAFDLPSDSGKLAHCAEISGVLLFVKMPAAAVDLSTPLVCGHSYTVKDSAQ